MKVSIIIPCYNGAGFVGQAIASALEQTYRNIEVLVVDDASTDASPEIIGSLARVDKRVSPIFLSANGGPASARNEALAAATGDWITLLDADDLYEPDRIERLLALARITGADIVVDNQSVRDFPDGYHVSFAFDFLRGGLPVPISQDLFFEESTVFGALMNPGYMKPMFRREFLAREGIRYRPDYRVGEDFFMYAECLCRRPSFYGTSYAGYIYRRRHASLTRSGAWALRTLAAMSDELIGEYGPRLTAVARESLLRRKRMLERYALLADLRTGLRERGWWQSSRMAMGNPGLLLLAPSIVRKRLPRLAGS